MKRVNRKGRYPNGDSRICSSHFVNFDLLEKMPCPMFPYPTLQMGYQLTPEQAREKRKPLSNRHSPPPIKKTKCSNLTEMITCDDDSVSETLSASFNDSNDKILGDKCAHPPQDTFRCKNCEIAARKI